MRDKLRPLLARWPNQKILSPDPSAPLPQPITLAVEPIKELAEFDPAVKHPQGDAAGIRSIPSMVVCRHPGDTGSALDPSCRHARHSSPPTDFMERLNDLRLNDILGSPTYESQEGEDTTPDTPHA